MATQSYLSRISKNADEKKSAQLKEAAEDAAIQLKADISAAKKAKREATKNLDSALSAIPFDSSDVLAAQAELKTVNEDIVALKAIETKYFADATPADEEETEEA